MAGKMMAGTSGTMAKSGLRTLMRSSATHVPTQNSHSQSQTSQSQSNSAQSQSLISQTQSPSLADVVSSSQRHNFVHNEDGIPESIAMLLRYRVDVPAQLLLSQLAWKDVLQQNKLPEDFRIRVQREHEQLTKFANRGYDLSPGRATTILREFQVWCSLVVPHAVGTADEKADGLLTEAMNKFTDGANIDAMPLNVKIKKVLELVKAGDLETAQKLAQRVEAEAARWSRNLDLLRLDIEAHLTTRAELATRLGLFGLGCGFVHLGADLGVGVRGDFYEAVRTTGVLLWKAVKQWIGGWEYEEFLQKHYRAEMTRTRMVNSMQLALDNALFERNFVNLDTATMSADRTTLSESYTSAVESVDDICTSQSTTSDSSEVSMSKSDYDGELVDARAKLRQLDALREKMATMVARLEGSESLVIVDHPKLAFD